MMMAQVLMRHHFGYDHSLKSIQKQRQMLRILRLINDNESGLSGAFSIQNIAKIGLCHDKLPGEWYGPHAISIMLRVRS